MPHPHSARVSIPTYFNLDEYNESQRSRSAQSMCNACDKNHKKWELEYCSEACRVPKKAVNRPNTSNQSISSGDGKGGGQTSLPQAAGEARTPPADPPHTPNTSKFPLNSETSQSSTQPNFSGEPGEDATIFINSIQKIAFAQGRQRDNDWQADYAGTCFTGSAMIRYCDLEDEKRLSWSDLRRALLQRFSPLPAPISPPAAAPPPAPTNTSGITTTNSNNDGYLKGFRLWSLITGEQ